MTDLSILEQKEIFKGFRGRFVHSAHTTLAFWDIDKGAVLPLHSHVHEQITYVLEGKFELVVDGKSMICEPGVVAVIPSNVPHSGVALTNCKIYDVFSPVREDYMNK